MARIRTVKPEFWTDEVIVELDFADRLLFIGLWNFADDQGYLPLRPKRIKMQVFPGDDHDVTAGLERLWKASLVSLYAHFDDLLIHVTNWKRHQKISNPATEKYLRADLRLLDSWPTDLASPLETYPAEGKGGEGKGRDLLSDESDEAPAEDHFEEFWETYSYKIKRTDATKAWAKAIHKEDPAHIISAASAYVAKINADRAQRGDRATAQAHAASWLNGERWNDDLNVRPIRPAEDPNAWMRRTL